MRVLGVGSKAALAADLTSSGVGLASGSLRAAAYLFFLPPERLRFFSHRGEVRVVRLCMSASIAFCTRCFDSASRADVASSSDSTLGGVGVGGGPRA